MSGIFFRPGYYDPSLLDGIDPATGLIPFDPPPPARPTFDPSALLAALGPPSPGMPTDPNALMALLRAAATARQPASALQPDFLQTVHRLITGAPRPGAIDTSPATAPFGGFATAPGSSADAGGMSTIAAMPGTLAPFAETPASGAYQPSAGAPYVTATGTALSPGAPGAGLDASDLLPFLDAAPPGSIDANGVLALLQQTADADLTRGPEPSEPVLSQILQGRYPTQIAQLESDMKAPGGEGEHAGTASPEGGSSLVNGVPVQLPNDETIPDPKSPTGKLMAPMSDLSHVAAAGRETGTLFRQMLSDPNSAEHAYAYLIGALYDHLGHGGKFDYQRKGPQLLGELFPSLFTQLRQFRNVSNFNVGLFCQQAGLSLEETLELAEGYASARSGNFDPTQPHGLVARNRHFIEEGFRAGQSGVFDSRPD
jgi:hypothetical protein